MQKQQHYTHYTEVLVLQPDIFYGNQILRIYVLATNKLQISSGFLIT